METGRGTRVADSRYVELPFEVAGMKRDLKVAIMPEFDADCYLGVNFVREFQTVLDPCSNQLLVKPAKRFVELELASVSGVDPISLSALDFADVTEGVRTHFQRIRVATMGIEEGPLGCTDWVEHEIGVGDT